MEKNNEPKRKNLLRTLIDSMAVRCSGGGKFVGRLFYESTSHSGALVHVDAILSRGNAAQMKNVAGKFLITELVMQ